MGRLGRALTAWAASCLAGLALGLAGAPAAAQVPQPAPEEVTDVDATYQQGLKAQRERRYADAINLLERVVLVDPDHAGAWLDLAISYFHAGDLATAANLFDHVTGQFRPAPPVAEVIARYRGQIDQRRAMAERDAQRAWRGEVGLGGGYARNINSAPLVGSVILTLGSQPLELPLSESQRPVHGAFARSDLLLTWAPPQGPRHWEAVAHVDSRIYPGRTEWNLLTTLVGASRTWARPGPVDAAWSLAVFGQRVELGGQGLQASLQAVARHRSRLGACVASLGLDLDRRTYPVDTILNSTVTTAVAGADCPVAALVDSKPRWLPDEFRADLRAGRDRPDGDRAGGAQDRWELAVLATHRLGLDRIDYSLQLGHYRDSASYSPLLAGGAARENLRRQGAVAYTRTLSPVTEAYAQLQLLRQSSNLSLFAVQMGSVQAGLRWKF